MIDFDIHGVAHRITADKYQWILARKHVNSKTGEVEYKGFSFQPSAAAMAEKLARLGADGMADDILAGVRSIEAALIARGVVQENRGPKK